MKFHFWVVKFLRRIPRRLGLDEDMGRNLKPRSRSPLNARRKGQRREHIIRTTAAMWKKLTIPVVKGPKKKEVHLIYFFS